MTLFIVCRLSSQLAGVNQAYPEPWVVSGAYSLVSNRFDQAISLAQKVSIRNGLYFSAVKVAV